MKESIDFLQFVFIVAVTNYYIGKSWNHKNNATIRKSKEDDVVIYKGFGHNPFGPSTRLITNGNKYVYN